jgi:hypothetical protein
MAAVLSSTGIRDYGNQMTHRQDTFGTSIVSSLAGVWVNIGIIRMGSDQHQHHQDVFEVISRTGQLVAKPS